MKSIITYSLTEEDAIALNKFRIETDPVLRNRVKKSRNRLGFSFAIFGIAFWILIEDAFLSILFLVLALIFFFFYKQMYARSVKKHVKETHKKPEYISAISDISLEVTSDGLVQTSNLGQTKFNWNQVDDFFETPDHFFISIGKVLSVTLPKASTQILDGDPGEFIKVCKTFTQQAS